VGTSASNEIQMAVLWAKTKTVGGIVHAGGTFDGVFAGGVGYATAPNSVYGLDPAVSASVRASATALAEEDDITEEGEDERWFVSGSVSWCSGPDGERAGDMVVVDFEFDGTTRSGWGNGNGAALFNTQIPSCIMGTNLDSNYAMVPNEPYLTLIGTSSSGNVLTERFDFSTGLRDTASYGPGPDGARPGFAYGPVGIGTSGVLVDPYYNIVIAGRGTNNDYLVARIDYNGALDPNFGQGGYLLIDFGTTDGVRIDGGKSVVLRSLDGGATYDILVAGYTFDSAAGKYKISLVDLQQDHFFRVT